jgi:hypothetical protein
VINVWILVADRFGNVGEVEFDRPAAAGLEVDEQRTVPGVEDVSRVRLSVEDLLLGGSPTDRTHRTPEALQEEAPIRFGELRRPNRARNELLGLPDPIAEVRR